MPVDFDITTLHGSCIPQELYVTNSEAYKVLRHINHQEGGWTDGIHSVVLTLFAFELAPVVADLYN